MTTVEIRPGQGGQDAEQFAGTVAKAISSWAQRNGTPATITDTARALTVQLPCTAAGTLAWLSGVHRIQHVPGKRTRGASKIRQTSYITVAVLPDDTAGGLQEAPLRSDPKITVITARGSGPGGQHRNKTETAVRARHEDYPAIEVHVNSGRSQTENLERVLAELRRRIDLAEEETARAGRNAARNAIAADVAFTHSEFLDIVKHHESGKVWPLSRWWQGRFDAA